MKFNEMTEIADVSGEATACLIRIGEMPNSFPYHIPIVSICGSTDGPTVLVHSGMHGDEVLGIASVRAAIKAIDPTRLRGRVLAIPGSNLAAVATRTRRNVVEIYPGPHDMNRVYPGNPNGIFSERVAAYVMDSLIPRADYVLDVHNASVGGRWMPYTTIPEASECPTSTVYDGAETLARAFGTELLISGNKYHGSLVQAAISAGVPGTMVEFGVANAITDDEVAFGVTGILNLLKQLGMLDGEVEAPERRMVVTELHKVTADRGGFLNRQVDVGDHVSEGDILATIEDLGGEVLQTALASATGAVCRVNTMGVVGTGDIIAYVAN